MDCRYLDDVYELFLLGQVKAKDAVEITGHIERGCPYCIEHLHEAAQSVYFLLSSAKPRKPNPSMKAETLRDLHRK